jgi:hypothetical protein
MSTRIQVLSASSLLVALALTGCSSEQPPPAPNGAGASPVGDPVPSAALVVDAAASLVVEDQTSEGPTVLAKAAATKGGFVVVYADGGRNTLGTGIVPPSTEPQDVQVSLAEEPTEQIELIARLFADTDGNGLFNAPDQPITNDEDDDSDDAEAFAGEQEAFSFQGKKVVNG